MTLVSSSTSPFSSYPYHLRPPHPFDPHSILIILSSLFSSNLYHLRLRCSRPPPNFHHVFILYIFLIQYLSSSTSSFSSSSHPSYKIFIRIILIPSLIKVPFLSSIPSCPLRPHLDHIFILLLILPNFVLLMIILMPIPFSSSSSFYLPH